MKHLAMCFIIGCMFAATPLSAQPRTPSDSSIKKSGNHVLVRQWVPIEALGNAEGFKTVGEAEAPLSADESATVRKALTQPWRESLPPKCFKVKVKECEWIYDEGLKLKRVCWWTIEIECLP